MDEVPSSIFEFATNINMGMSRVIVSENSFCSWLLNISPKKMSAKAEISLSRASEWASLSHLFFLFKELNHSSPLFVQLITKVVDEPDTWRIFRTLFVGVIRSRFMREYYVYYVYF
jgi:hypothetical protein